MNCMVKCLSWAVDKPMPQIYTGIGHCEPIHMDEIIAYCLTIGYALVPRDTLVEEFAAYRVLVEGVSLLNEPHMIGLDARTRVVYDPGNVPLIASEIYWYLFPCRVNERFRVLHTTIRTRWITEVTASWGIC